MPLSSVTAAGLYFGVNKVTVYSINDTSRRLFVQLHGALVVLHQVGVLTHLSGALFTLSFYMCNTHLCLNSQRLSLL